MNDKKLPCEFCGFMHNRENAWSAEHIAHSHDRILTLESENTRLRAELEAEQRQHQRLYEQYKATFSISPDIDEVVKIGLQAIGMDNNRAFHCFERLATRIAELESELARLRKAIEEFLEASLESDDYFTAVEKLRNAMEGKE